VLMDLSRSTGDRIGATGDTVLGLAREAVVLLAEAMNELGDRFAIHAFTSNGRRDVTYYRFKDFDAEYDHIAKAYLAGASAQLSTRMGAALRHAGQLLRVESSDKKLLLLITDGEPSDVDVFDPQYLTLDAKKAVESLTRYGIQAFCMSLDAKADRYVSRVFGAKNYLVVDRLVTLPEKLPLIYMRLTHC
jgi:nitric oxide reductase NorD protein